MGKESITLSMELVKTKSHEFECLEDNYYFGGARSKGFATLRNVSKLQFFEVGFRLYSAI